LPGVPKNIQQTLIVGETFAPCSYDRILFTAVKVSIYYAGHLIGTFKCHEAHEESSAEILLD